MLLRRSSLLALLALLGPTTSHAQQIDPRMYSEMRWRMIGPHRASRTKAAAGIPDQPNVFYMGVVNGGVWKTTDYGRTWTPIFDDQPTGSIGAIASRHPTRTSSTSAAARDCSVPTSRPATGSTSRPTPERPGRTSACATASRFRRSWSIRAIRIACSSRCMGHPYGPNAERGFFRSTDGGTTFRKSYTKTRTPARSTWSSIPSTRDIVYCVLWEARQGPWENGAFSGPGSGLFKSTDGGATWRKLGKGLPTFEQDGLGRIGITVAPSMPSRMFATVDATRERGLYRSDDAGENWYSATTRHARVVARVRFRRGESRSEESGRRVYGERRDVEVDRRRQHLQRVSRRAGWRRLSPHLDQSEQLRHDADRQRSGRDHHGERRRVMELVVQPAHGCVLSRIDGQRVSRIASAADSRSPDRRA